MTTVRLPIDYEQKLDFLANLKKKTKSEIIKEALDVFFTQEESELDSYKLGESFFGLYGSGDGSLSTTYKKKLKEKINAKRNSY
ncbi:MAG: CopG family transcriptional regulator [Spirochaetes bacterium GWF1_31_7]|nr:MAG: CopG family transcriptional regulator [Spirochaetes bacterium GWE1_32_154]OHD51310.1 MAG: CopG family transcriptional regulator [Spirochaetes bacterium GWE2_31_10]OHD51507.1 MAG: CopG family transcriptional regulator [Spirochaetes bacterium GWF1_31_7]OHD79934.1 MAG: CopG family transcriptional regulator [Spirochaetes bacterium RIFOXYB1_FULL_32_8]HBD95969.1 CopG family transcriptional regulator [Spirochaetia bacterium]